MSETDVTNNSMELLDEGTGISGGPVPVNPRARPNLVKDGNKKGMPEIAKDRNRLGKAFMARMRADFQKHGIAVIEKVRKERPAAYLELIARLMPQQMEINVQHSFVDVLLQAQKQYEQENAFVIEAERVDVEPPRGDV